MLGTSNAGKHRHSFNASNYERGDNYGDKIVIDIDKNTNRIGHVGYAWAAIHEADDHSHSGQTSHSAKITDVGSPIYPRPTTETFLFFNFDTIYFHT